jgi:hypothetical protein
MPQFCPIFGSIPIILS